MESLSYTLFSVVFVSLVSFAGALTFALKDTILKSVIFVLVSVSAGALFGDAFIHLIPEAFSEGNQYAVSITVVLGIFSFFIFEKFLSWRHTHGVHEETTESIQLHNHQARTLGPLVLVSDSVHNFIDGVIIASSYMFGIEIGIATTIAVLLHEIPQEIGDFGLLIHSGYSRSQALFYNFLSALTAILGSMAAFFFGPNLENFIPTALAFAAGSFVYIAGSDLVPELQKTHEIKRSLVQMFCMFLGFALMLLLLYVA